MRLRSLLISITCLLGLSLNAQLYTFRNFNHRDGLYMATINCLEQTADGYIWIGTDGGDLVRYNGDQFEEIREKNGDNNHHFMQINAYGDSLMIASQYKGFIAFLRKEKKFVKVGSNEGLSEALGCIRSDSSYYFIGKGGIKQSDLDGNSKTLFTRKKYDLELYQTIRLNKAVVISTNHGVFVAEGSRFQKLNDWLGTNLNDPDSFHFGYFTDSKLVLFSDKGDRFLEVVMNSRGGFFSIKEEDLENNLQTGEKIISTSYNQSSEILGLLTNQGRIYIKRGADIQVIAHNYNQPLEETRQILTDINGDFWLASRIRGIYKVSLEGFTKLQTLSIYEKPNIMFPYRTIYGDIIISTQDGETYIRNLVDTSFQRKFNFSLHGATEINGDYYFASNVGIKKYHPQSSPDFETIYFNNVRITMITSDGNTIYAGVAGKGLYTINAKSGEIKKVESDKTRIQEYFYTSQFASRKKLIYFGTNNGIYKYEKATGNIEAVNIQYDKLGGYSGVSTKDIYGTCWFTLEKGIVGISEREEIIVINGDKNFNTNIFYTLNSDNFGNLIIGTNKGIFVTKIDKKGVIKDNRHYDGNSGFDGYETHMRSQFQNDQGIFVGTIEGLFLINTRILENLKSPLAPVIIDIEDPNTSKREANNNFLFEFHVNNHKAGKISYSYRLIGESDEWMTTENNRLPVYDLSNGEYALEVRSSYDGLHFSKPAIYKFNVHLPIWRSNWFIITTILLVVVANIMLLRYNKAFETNNLLDTKDTMVHLKMTPSILLFATISVSFAHIAAPYFSNELKLHLETTLAVSFVLLTLYLLSLSARTNKQEYLYQYYLIIALIVVITHFYYELYLSNLHPYHIIGIVITSTVVPFILNRTRSVIIFAILILALSSIIALLVHDPVYPKSYFMIAISVMSSLLVFTSYLRYDSIEKMMFISGIINKGNIPAIAFNREGIITYASENISLFINANHDEILGNHISTLNHHIPFEGNFRDVDVLKEFKDGGHYLVPMLGSSNKSKWIEWSYKDFSSNVKVMLGQDVSDRMEMENTYELLVQNAEDFIYRCDISGNFVFMNDISFRKLGYSEEELIGKASTMIVDEDFREEVANYYRDHFNERRHHSYKEFPIRTKNGRQIWIGQFVTTLFAAGSDSYINGYIALARDITKDREQQQLIKDQRDSITASINYARRIQLNLLPHERMFASLFKEHFIIYKPKDIVSGDFYWMHKRENTTVLALADCTGHGVPGSFMTLLGINLLNTIVQEEGITDPGQILAEMDARLVEILPRNNKENKVNDGMEITVCLFNDDSDEMSFACAGSRFLIFRNGEFTMYKGDIKHIGDKPQTGFTGYQTNFTEVGSDDQLYLFTDGFQDQFGGPDDKKYLFRRFLELLESNNSAPLHEQREIIEQEFDEWIGNGEQTDDITLVSIIRNKILSEEKV